MALRLGQALPDLVNEDQVGFIKGRRASTLIRLVDDLIEHLNSTNSPGLLVSIDYCQEFDSISKDFMINSFKKFGFGEEFVRWVEVLMADTQSCISYCGWISEYFPAEAGIRQGCPFSPLAFVLALELLAITIRSNESIKGINMGRNGDMVEKIIKIALYADDVTLFLKDELSMRHALTIFQNFSSFSGLRINQSKSKAMWLGNRKNSEDTFYGFNWEKRIKILGIYFENDKSASSIEENWLERLEKIKRIIHSWERRNLSIMGKICIIKTFLISQLVYVMQALILPDKFLTEVNRIFFRFLWRKRDCNRRAFE